MAQSISEGNDMAATLALSCAAGRWGCLLTSKIRKLSKSDGRFSWLSPFFFFLLSLGCGATGPPAFRIDLSFVISLLWKCLHRNIQTCPHQRARRSLMRSHSEFDGDPRSHGLELSSSQAWSLLLSALLSNVGQSFANIF